MTEDVEWREIPSRPGYEASSAGQLRWGGEEVTAWCSGNGYRYARIYLKSAPHRPGGWQDLTVHSLVAEAFHGPRPRGQETRHLNGDRLDCRASNLAWGTPTQNRLDSVRHGTNSICRYNEKNKR